MSDYVAANRLGDYYNIEAQHGHLETQKQMIDRLMQHLGRQPVAHPSPFDGPFLSLRSVDQRGPARPGVALRDGLSILGASLVTPGNR